MAKKVKDNNILVPLGVFLGAILVGAGAWMYNKLKKNKEVTTFENNNNGTITASTGTIGGGGGSTTTSSIVAQNQTLSTVTAGTTANAIQLSSLVIENCAENANRTIVSIGSGITLKKNGVALSVGETFIASDNLTYDVANNVAATNAKSIFTYRANGVCGDSNVATISANVLVSGTATISIINHALNPINSGTLGVSVAFSAPTIANGCVFSGNRILKSIGSGIIVKKNGSAMSINDTWANSDTITVDVDGSVATTTAKTIFTYAAVGTCGESNVATVSANVTFVSNGSIPSTTYFVFTSFVEYIGNIGTTKYWADLYSLYNSIMIESSRVSSIMEGIKSSSTSGLVVGATLYKSNNVAFTNTGYMAFVESNGDVKFIQLSSGAIISIGILTAPSITGETQVVFPYYTYANDNSTGYGYLADNGAWWKHRLNMAVDGQTINYVFENGNFNAQNPFTFNDGTHSYSLTKYFTINRVAKINGTPDGYKIPDMYRGSLIELIFDVDVVTAKSGSESDQQYADRIGNVKTNFNASFLILLAK